MFTRTLYFKSGNAQACWMGYPYWFGSNDRSLENTTGAQCYMGYPCMMWSNAL